MLLTIVTPTLNCRDTIAEAIVSAVTAAGSADFEHVVVDGGSTDGTLDVLAGFPHLKVVRHPEGNLYDALNLGVSLSRGGVLTFLNGDDLCCAGGIPAALAALAADGRMESVCGGAGFFVGEPPDRRTIGTITDERVKRLRVRDVVSGVPIVNARFFRRSLFERLGGFDSRFPIASDRDFLFRMVLAGVQRGTLPGVVYAYRSHHRSLTLSGTGQEKFLHENWHAAFRRCGEPAPDDHHRAYLLWHAWAAGYLTCHQLRRGCGPSFPLGAAFRVDSWWPFRFLAQIPAHWWERTLRR